MANHEVCGHFPINPEARGEKKMPTATINNQAAETHANTSRETLLRPNLAGLRVKDPQTDKIYLVDPDGRRRYIPGPPTYNKLFTNWDGILTGGWVSQITDGEALIEKAHLAQVGRGPIYLLDKEKHQIVNPQAMQRYHFAGSHIDQVTQDEFDAVPTGLPWL
jgi:hypothetical protein